MWFFNKEPYHLPRATGPYPVGAVDVHLGYSKDGVFFRIYYPTTKTKEEIDFERCRSFIPSNDYVEGLAKVIMLKPILMKMLFWKTGNPLIPILYGGKVSAENKLKCIIMSHGLGAYRGFYNTCLMELASRGYMVFSLEHRDQSSCYTYYYESKTNAENDIKTPITFRTVPLGKEHFAARNQQVHKRSDECIEVYNFLQQLSKGTIEKDLHIENMPDIDMEFKLEDLFGKIDTENIIMMGHSFGGATALLTLSRIPGLKCGVLLDPWMFPIKGENVPEKTKQSLLFINTQTFHIDANVKALEEYDATNMFTILHTTHEHQTDSVLVIGSWLNWFMKKMNPMKALKLNNYLIFKFLKQQTCHSNFEEDYEGYLEENANYLSNGVPKPWA